MFSLFNTRSTHGVHIHPAGQKDTSFFCISEFSSLLLFYLIYSWLVLGKSEAMCHCSFTFLHEIWSPKSVCPTWDSPTPWSWLLGSWNQGNLLVWNVPEAQERTQRSTGHSINFQLFTFITVLIKTAKFSLPWSTQEVSFDLAKVHITLLGDLKHTFKNAHTPLT